MKVFSVTHLGLVRKNNEDRFLVKKLGNGSALVAVAHGMGGHVAGERAAEIAVETMNGFDAGSTDVDAHLVELARTANCSIKEASAKDLSLNGMGTTLTAALVAARLAHWVHVGDSRIYVFREGELAAVTEDHTIAGLLLRSGEISAEEARVHPMRKVLMSCLRGADFEMDSGTLELEAGDLLMLSTDGLHDRVPEREILYILRRTAGLEEKLNGLIQLALESGGRDNITTRRADTVPLSRDDWHGTAKVITSFSSELSANFSRPASSLLKETFNRLERYLQIPKASESWTAVSILSFRTQGFILPCVRCL